MNIHEYKILREFSSSYGVRMFQAARTEDDERVIIKTFSILSRKSGYREVISELVEKDYRISNHLAGSGVVLVPHCIKKWDDMIVIEFKNFDGIPICDLRKNLKLDLIGTVRLALRIAGALEIVHKNGIVHGNLHPKSIFYSFDHDSVKFTHFWFSIRKKQEGIGIVPKTKIGLELEYVPPEQKIRSSGYVDQRSDLYMLGICLYEWLAGRRPYAYHDHLELFHSHLTRVPAEMENVPKVIDAIVKKLLAKSPQDRYGSAVGLAGDLDRCLRESHDSGTIHWFEIGKDDFMGNARIPKKLYGRKHEFSKILHGIYEREDHRQDLIIVSGGPGVGKTALVMELGSEIMAKGGLFLSGKYEMDRQKVPYTGIKEIMRGFAAEFLGMKDEELCLMREKLKHGLAGVADVIVELIPEFQKIIGDVKIEKPLSPGEAMNRFFLAIRRFIAVVCEYWETIVLFFDDMQWADTGSFLLIEDIAKNGLSDSLCLVLGHRNIGSDMGTGIEELKNNLRKSGINIGEIVLRGLGSQTVGQIIQDTFKRNDARIKKFSQIVWEKTEGNPFFIAQYVRYLDDQGIFNHNEAKGWDWSIKAIEQKGAPESVGLLMKLRLKSLPEDVVRILSKASCIGRTFTMDELAVAWEGGRDEKPKNMHAGLMQLERKGFLNPMVVGWQFCHDEVFMSVRQKLSVADQKAIHLNLGKYYLHCSETGLKKIHAAKTADHFIQAGEFAIKESGILRLADLYVEAGKNSLNVAAFGPARHYLEAGIAVLPDKAWEQTYELAFQLHLLLGECAFFSGHTEYGQRIFRSLLEAELRREERGIAVQRLCFHYMMVGGADLAEAIRVGRNALRMCGVELPLRYGRLRTMLGFLNLRLALLGKNEEYFLSIGMVKDPCAIMTHDISLALAQVASVDDISTTMFLVFKQVKLLLRYGLHWAGPVAFALYSIMVTTKNPAYGKLMAEASMGLAKRLHSPSMEAWVEYYVHIFTLPWIQSYGSLLPEIANDFTRLMNAGNFIFAVPCLEQTLAIKFIVGQPLINFKKECDQAAKVMIDCGCLKFATMAQRLGLIADLLMGNRLDLIASDDPLQLASIQNISFKSAYRAIIIHGLCGLYVLGKTETAWRLINTIADGFTSGPKGTPQESEFVFYAGLVAAKIVGQNRGKHRRRLIRFVRCQYRKMHWWSTYCAENYACKADILLAEIFRLSGEWEGALRVYRRAAEKAAAGRYTHYQAIICELQGNLSLKMGRPVEVGMYLRQARLLYWVWGARAKVESMEAEYGDVITDWSTDQDELGFSYNGTGNKDLIMIVEACREISRQTQPDQVIQKAMNSIMAYTKAERGYLVLKKHEKLWVEAESVNTLGKIKVVHSRKLKNETVAMYPLFRRVINSGVFEILTNMEQSILYNGQSFQISFPISILCMPVRKHNLVIGALCLEKDQVIDFFYLRQIGSLEILISQMTISIENAKIYPELHKEIRERRSIQKGLEEKSNMNRLLLNNFPHAALLIRRDGLILAINGQASKKGARIGDHCWNKFAVRHYGLSNRGGFCNFCQAKGTLQGCKIEREIKLGRSFWHVYWIFVDDEKFFTYSVDISEAKQAEAILQVQQQQLAQADKLASLGTLGASIASDISKPNETMMKKSLLLQKKCKELGYLVAGLDKIGPDTLIGGLPREIVGNELNRLAKDVERGSERVKGILDELQTISTGKGRKKHTCVNLNAVVKAGTGLLNSLIKESTKHFKVEYGHIPCVEGNIQQLEQVVVNLVQNACQALSNREESIRIRTYYDKIKHKVVMDIEDQGEGIKDGNLENLKKPFFTTKKGKGGFGLGLTISERIVTAHGGELIIQPNIGKGTRVRVFLP